VDVRLLTPFGALLALTALAPLAAYLVRERRLRVMRRTLGLASPPLRSRLPLVLALAAVPALLGLAAAQPVVETTRTVPERTDAQAFVVLDVSRSMLASEGAGAPTRFERARELARDVRAAFPEIPFGVATLTDRVLPHLFPTTDARVFEATLDRALDIEKPPPGAFYLTYATDLNTLRDLPAKHYFLPSARTRVVVVLTDGETQPPTDDLARAFEPEPRTQVLLVRLWGLEEGIYETGVAEGAYEPDPRSASSVARVASLVGGRTFEEGETQSLYDAVRSALGAGETVPRTQRSGRIALMPYVTLVALLPLAVVLLGRNVWWAPRRRRERMTPAATGEQHEAAAQRVELSRAA